MTRHIQSSGFESDGSAFDSSTAAQHMFNQSQAMCALVDKVPVLALRLMSSPINLTTSRDYEDLVTTNDKFLSFILSVSEFAEVI